MMNTVIAYNMAKYPRTLEPSPTLLSELNCLRSHHLCKCLMAHIIIIISPSDIY